MINEHAVIAELEFLRDLARRSLNLFGRSCFFWPLRAFTLCPLLNVYSRIVKHGNCMNLKVYGLVAGLKHILQYNLVTRKHFVNLRVFGRCFFLVIDHPKHLNCSIFCFFLFTNLTMRFQIVLIERIIILVCLGIMNATQ